jgi:AraC family transcriptional regulator, activator of mtrCDE
MAGMDVLSEILRTLKVQGSLYFRTAFSPPWGVLAPHYGKVARFHLVTRGACWVRVENVAQPIRMERGDLIVIPHGAEHHLLDELTTAPLAVDEVVQQAGFVGEGALVWGAEPTAEPTCMVCGHFTFDAERGALLHESLPIFIYVPHTETLNYNWLDEAMKFIAHEAAANQPGGEAIVNRLSEIIFIQTIRWYASTSNQMKGLLAALADEQLGKSLQAFHRNPGQLWTVEELARAAAMSRTLFSERMRKVMGMSPMEYATQWRMEIAHEALTDRRVNVAEIAEAVGYQSLSAFTRAFKKQFGRGPGEVRRAC